MKRILLPLLLGLSTLVSIGLIALTILDLSMVEKDGSELVVDLVPSGESLGSPFTRISLPAKGGLICYNELAYIVKTDADYCMLIKHDTFYPGMIDYMLNAIFSVNDDSYTVVRAGKRFRITIGEEQWKATHISNGEIVMVLITKT